VQRRKAASWSRVCNLSLWEQSLPDLLATPTRLSNADLNVPSRSKTRLAPVRNPEYIDLTFVEQPAYTCQDVTTRGEYYPDKNMATAAVSICVHIT
jgi:hypothetical protein